MGKSLSLVEYCRRSLDVVGLEKVEEAHVLTPPLMCWYLGRQGSSAKGSWEKTESSPEEQELRVSGKLGEYCSIGAHRSRYSSLVAKVRIRSKSSTNCLNVGLWEEIACQQSFIIMYNSLVQLAGLSMR